MYLFLSSTDCLKTHPANSPWDFTVDLKHNVHLKGEWEIALMEINYEGPSTKLYIFSDLCSDSHVGNNYLPLLRIVQHSSSFKNPYFIPVPRDFVDRIRVYIRTEKGEIPSFVPSQLRCTLQVRQKHVCY